MAADVLNSLLIRATGQTLQIAYRQSLKSLDLDMISETMGNSLILKARFFFKVLLQKGICDYMKHIDWISKSVIVL